MITINTRVILSFKQRHLFSGADSILPFLLRSFWKLSFLYSIHDYLFNEHKIAKLNSLEFRSFKRKLLAFEILLPANLKWKFRGFIRTVLSEGMILLGSVRRPQLEWMLQRHLLNGQMRNDNTYAIQVFVRRFSFEIWTLGRGILFDWYFWCKKLIFPIQ